MSEELFRDTVYTVSKQLSPEESNQLAYLYHLPSQFLEPSCKPLNVLVQLENQQLITGSNPDTLARAMEKIERKDLAKKVRAIHKKKKASEKTKRHGSTSDGEAQYQSAQIGLTLWHAETAADGIRHILKSWSCQEVSDEMKTAMRHCIAASEALYKATTKFELRDSAFPVATEETSDEDNSPHSSMTLSNIQETTTNISTRPSMRQKPKVPPKPQKKSSPLKSSSSQQEDRHRAQSTQICHGRIATPLVMVSSKEDQGIPEDVLPPNEEEDYVYATLSYTGTTGDSGFSDAREFLRVDLPLEKREELANRPPAPLPETSSPGYMPLIRKECTVGEYTSVQHMTIGRPKIADTTTTSSSIYATTSSIRAKAPPKPEYYANVRSNTLPTIPNRSSIAKSIVAQPEAPLYVNTHRQALTPPSSPPKEDTLYNIYDDDTYTMVRH